MCLNFNFNINPVEILTTTWKAASRPCGYLRDPRTRIAGLDDAMDKLNSLKMDIENKIQLAELDGLRPIHQVHDWLAKVSVFGAKVSKIKDDRQNGYANWRINRRVRKRKAEIDALLESGAFENVADKHVPPVVQEVNDAKLPNTNRYLSQLQAYLQDDDDGSRIIGIWGMGGVGKTTLLKCLNDEMQTLSKSGQTPPEFDYVIWAVASKDYKLENMQRQVVQRLGLPSHEEKEEQATVIFNFLKNKSFLLLLDDLWQPLDFTVVGFPHPLRTEASGPKRKVFFTTRLEGVCGKMQARRILKLECLNEDEAWRLFQDKVGEETLRAHAMIHQLAQQVVKECHGLPLALVVIGAAMSTKKTPMEWHNAIALLKKSKLPEIPDMEEDNFLPKLKLSYDNLADEAKQKCFLLSCLWQNCFNIKKTELIECWMGHGFVDVCKFDNINEAYDSGHALISSFLAACLLEPGDNPDKEVKMHDVIKKLAVWIASDFGEKPNKFIVKHDAYAYAYAYAYEDAHCEVERMLLSQLRIIGEFPSKFSKLETLILRNIISPMSDLTKLFKGTPTLTYLDLSDNNISECPPEIGLLINLRYLNLSRTYIKSLPLQLGNLCELKFLILRHMYKDIIIPEGLIEKLEKLSVIDMPRAKCKNWKEILGLRGFLKGVAICLTTTESLQLFQLSNVPIWQLELRGLVGFNGSLQLGSLSNQSSIQRLIIEDCESLNVVSIDHNSQRGNLSRLDELELYDLPELNNNSFKGVVHAKMMSSLTKLTISGCNKLLNISWVMHLPSLTVLNVSNCPEMKQIIDEDSDGDTSEDENDLSARESDNAFTSIKEISLHDLPRLRIFANELFAFPLLEVLYVSLCPEMKKLSFGLEIINKSLKKIYGKKSWWEELEMEEDVRAALSRFFDENCLMPWHEGGSAMWSFGCKVKKRMADSVTSLEGDSSFGFGFVPQAVEEVSVVEQSDNLSMGSYISQLRAYLQDNDNQTRIIGILGKGGIGKTTLLQWLNIELQSSSKCGQISPQFYIIIWVVASKDNMLEMLQNQIRKQLGLPWHSENTNTARLIFQFLKDKSFLLLIDDLWQPFDYAEVGIPHPLRAGTSVPKQKVVFTTRFEGVCGNMQARCILKLECLNENEAWRLFQTKVGEETLQAHVMIPQLARQVAEECNGHPLALMVIGAAMRTKKTPMEWHNAITLLEKSRLPEMHDMEEENTLPKVINLIYNLADEIKQKSFLLCCLWPKNFSIKKIKLIECWMGHGLIDVTKFDNIYEASNSGQALICSMLATCLLEPGTDPYNEVKMNYEVRDIGLWIASNYGEKPNNFIVNSCANGFEDTHSEVERMMLDKPDITFNHYSNYSKLETLILYPISYMSWPTGFFKRVSSLVYLDLSESIVGELPSEIGLLSNLRYFNLSYTAIKYLPLQLGYLSKLRFLLLRFMCTINIPDGLIEKLGMLYVIDMTGTWCKNWKELSRLRGFSKDVNIFLKTTMALQRHAQLSNVNICELRLERLVEFKGPLQLGNNIHHSSIQKLDVMFCLSLKVVSFSPNSQRGTLSKLDELNIKHLPKLKNIIFRGVEPSEMMPRLTKLRINCCDKLLNISWAIRLPSLEVLYVYKCSKMKQVIDKNNEGETIADENVTSAGESGDAFPRLKSITLRFMPSLRKFSNGLLAFPSLERLEVIQCPEMKTLPFGLKTIGKRLEMIYGDKKWWEELEMEEDVRAALLPRFLETQGSFESISPTCAPIFSFGLKF